MPPGNSPPPDRPPAAPAERFERAMKLWERLLGTATTIGLIAGGAWTVWTYFRHQDDEAAQRHREYLLELRKEKRELYQPLCTAAARIATAKTMNAAEADVAKFWELYWGPVHFIADEDFQPAKERFREELMNCLERGDQPPSPELRQRSHELALAVQKAIDLHIDADTGPGRPREGRN